MNLKIGVRIMKLFQLTKNNTFVVCYKILYNDDEYEDNEDIEDDDGEKFRIFISSLRLLNIASTSQHIHADATYKLMAGFSCVDYRNRQISIKLFIRFAFGSVLQREERKIFNLFSTVFKLVCKKLVKIY